MADIFDEIQDELKQDRMATLWAKYGVYVIGAAIAIILVVAGYQGYQSWQISTKTKAADSFHAALQSDDVFSSLAETRAELSGGYSMLAGFSQAALLAENGDAQAAEQAYLDLSADSAIEPLYQDIALLLSVMVADENQSAQTLLDRISPLMSTANVLQGLALEQGAGLDIKNGDIQSAREKLEQIATLSDISANLRRRAEQLLSILTAPVGSSN
jgi:hypothetical protein